jgi:hypothetical protein
MFIGKNQFNDQNMQVFRTIPFRPNDHDVQNPQIPLANDSGIDY